MLWDEEKCLMEFEKQHYKDTSKLESYPRKCCGNSPGKGRNRSGGKLTKAEGAKGSGTLR